MTHTLPPRWLKGAAVILIVWALAGGAAFASQALATPEDIAALPVEQQEMWGHMPGWAWAAYGVAVLARPGAAVCMVPPNRAAARRARSSPIAVLVQFSYPFILADGLNRLGAGALVFPMIIIGMAALQSWLARDWTAKGWLS